MLKTLFPVLQWAPGYGREAFRGDVNAGLTVAVMLIPQGMAVALLAGLPPIMGLYASVLPLLVYGLLGTSRQLAVGPVALISLLVLSGVKPLAAIGSDRYIALVIALALLVGVIQLLMGVFRLGFLVNFLSHPVIAGFTAAAAFIIAFGQLEFLMGVPLPHTHHVHAIIFEAIRHAGETNVYTFVMGSAALAAILIMRHHRPRWPAALMAVIVTTTITWGLDMEAQGVAVVGSVPRGLPAIAWPDVSFADFRTLLVPALTIAFVGFMESIAIAKNFASRHRYAVDANQELIAQGAANLLSAMSQGYAVTGSFSRTAVNNLAGARTGMASIFTALLIALVLYVLTPLFHHLPHAVLAAVVIAAVTSLVDVHQARRLYHIQRSEFAVMLFAFLSTLTLGIDWGIVLSMAMSLGMMIRRTTHPHTAVLGKIPGREVYRNFERSDEAEEIDGLVIFRIDAPLYFANVAFLRETIEELINDQDYPVRTLIFDASSVPAIDASADEALHEIARDLDERGIDLYMAHVRGPVRDLLRRSGFYERLGEDHFFFSKKAAVQHYLDTREPEGRGAGETGNR